jgi:hypothetical protein
LLLLFGYFSISIQFMVRKYYSCSYIINCPVGGFKSPFGCSPLLYYNHWPISKFRDPSMKLLLRKNIALSFEDMEYKETYVLDLSRQSRRRYIIRQLS